MKMKLRYVLIICFLNIGVLTFAQQTNIADFDSTHFLFPQFTDGVITMKDGSEARGKLNYNTVADEMQFINTRGEILALAEPAKVMKVVISDRNFIYLKNYFVELLSEGTVSLFYRTHVKLNVEKIGAYGGTSSSSSIESLSTYTRSDGMISKLTPNVKISMRKEFVYYVIFGTTVKMVTSKIDLFKYFSSNKELIKQEIEKQKTDFGNVESVKKIIEWMNARGIKS